MNFHKDNYTLRINKLKANLTRGNIDNKLINNLNIPNNFGNTLFNCSILLEDIPNILLLLKLNINLNIKNNDGNMSLHVIIIKISILIKDKSEKLFIFLDILKRMIERGANRNIKNNVDMSFNDIINLIINNNIESGNTLTHLLVVNHMLDCAIFFIKNFKPILDIKNDYGNTVLHTSVYLALKNYENIEYFHFILKLLKNNINENIKNNQGLIAGDFFLHFYKN